MTKLQHRFEEMEKGNAVLRNLDLEQMVKPGDLEDKCRTEREMVFQKIEELGTFLMNRMQDRFNYVSEDFAQRIMERVSKRDFKDNAAFLLQ